MRVCLIRHGSTAGNLEKRYVGTTDEPLTDGAVHALKELQVCPGADQEARAVIVSPLRRCIETARLLFPQEKLRIAEDLRECAFGKFEYKNYQELSGDPDYQAWIDSGGELPFPGGESRAAFADRCCRAFVQACVDAQQDGYKEAVFVVHGGTIMAVMERFALPHRPYFEWQVKNAEGFSGGLFWKTDAHGKQRPEIKEISTWNHTTLFIKKETAAPAAVWTDKERRNG